MSVITARAAVATRSLVVPLGIALLLVAAVAAVVIFLRTQAPAAASTADATTPSPSAILQAVERRATADDGRIDIQAILATPAYLRVTGQLALAEKRAASGELSIIFSEDIHFGELPARPVWPIVVDGRVFAPTKTDVVFDSDHHRTSVLTYIDPAAPLATAGVALTELKISGADGALVWERPFADAGRTAQGGLSAPIILALMGGMLASMWPCLFQLTAYFLPSVAGLSLEEARGGRADRAVLRTAVLFVSGIVIVYTVAGLAAGFAAQSVSGTEVFQAARGPLTFIAGLVVIGMAVRLALKARSPLVCHMPTTAPTPRQGLGTVALGLAFATGCMSCFGAAVILGMFTYIVTTASPWVGAAILFVFSLGIAIPLVFAAMAMARVLPLLTRLERAMPVLTLVSAAIMAGYGILLVTGTSHVMSDAVARFANQLR
ncbi:MAG TPA: cytochrome c biogenesis protein CcdA [Candidatus Limnocylindria bacterium]